MRRDQEDSIEFNVNILGKKYGTLPVGTISWGDFKVNYRLTRKIIDGYIDIAYDWNSPGKKEVIKERIRMGARISPKGQSIWHFVCPIAEHKKCIKTPLKLFIGYGKRFGCIECSDVGLREWRRHDPIEDSFVKSPERIKEALNSPYTSSIIKIKALDALNRITKTTLILKKKYLKLKYRGKGIFHKKSKDPIYAELKALAPKTEPSVSRGA